MSLKDNMWYYNRCEMTPSSIGERGVLNVYVSMAGGRAAERHALVHYYER